MKKAVCPNCGHHFEYPPGVRLSIGQRKVFDILNEEEYIHIDAIAERLGITKANAHSQISQIRRKIYPTKWAILNRWRVGYRLKHADRN